MSWKNAIAYAKGLTEKTGLITKESRQDDGLPLNAKIGGVINFQKSPFIKASALGSLITVPDESHSLITSISRVHLNVSGKVYRYYFASGDNGEKEIFLQLYVAPDGQVLDAIFCEQLTRIIPESREEQELFMGINGEGLGELTYSLSKDQLLSIGFSESLLNGVINQGTGCVDYIREFGDEEDQFVAPCIGTETRIDDANGVKGVKQEIYYMAYRRELTDGMNEYMFISTEVVQSKDGNANSREIHVDIMVGIPLSLSHITVS